MYRLFKIDNGAALLLVVVFASNFGINESHAESPKIQVLDQRALPLGDGKVSHEPRRGYVYACNSQFRGGGAQHTGSWIQGSTWDVTQKIWVQGDVAWPNARFSLSSTEHERLLNGNGLPVGNTTGIFPVQSSDPAYLIDRNPNPISAQQLTLALPLAPTFAASPSCVPMGMIGVALNGVAIFNALDDAGRDAVAHEVQDHCHGHPQKRGQYHYHGPSDCVPGAASNNTLVGYALDGFGIYSGYDEQGKEITNADLDACHGRVSRILWNGKMVDMYHYVFTREYPYSVGCFRGTPMRAGMQAQDAAPATDRAVRRGGMGAPRQPPEEAIAACAGQSPDTLCRFTSLRGRTIAGNCRTLGGAGGTLACVPERH